MIIFREQFINIVFGLKDSDVMAFCIASKMYSYKQLFDYVEQIYDATSHLKDELIGLYAADDIRTYAAILALWLQGKAYVPLNPSQPVNRHIETLVSIRGRYVISSKGGYTLGVEDVEMVYTDSFKSEGYKRKGTMLVAEVSDDTLAYILFTSGSTGKPKGVQITRGNVAHFIDSMNHIGLDITSADKCLQPFDLTFDFSVSSYVIPLTKGASIYTIPNNVMKFTYISSLLEEYHLTVLQMVPSMIRNLLPYLDEVELRSVRYNILCGEALTGKVIKRWHEGNQEMVSYNMYGPTEDTVFCTFYLIDKSNIADLKAANDIICIGKTFQNSGLLILDDDDKVVTESNKMGELCLCGDQLTPGYWENEKENTAKFFEVDNVLYYRTGDLCYSAEDGNLMFVSRKDFQVKINGYRVELGEIESLYTEVSNGKHCVVMPYQNAQNNAELAIVIEGREYDYTVHKKYLVSKLPKYMVPSHWLFVKNMPLNQNGKVDRKIIGSMFNF